MAARRWFQLLVVAGLLALFVWRELAAVRADGVTLDEPVHLAYGEQALRQGTFERARDLFNSKAPVSVLNALPVVLAERGMGGGALGGEARLRLARLPTVALAALLGWLVWLWAVELFGAGGGALALFLYTFCPNVLAHGHLVTTDVATALGMFGATYAFWRYRRRRGASRLAVAALAFGAAQLTKATAIFLAPIFVLIVLAEWVGVWLAVRRGRHAVAGAAASAAGPGPAADRGGAVRSAGDTGAASTAGTAGVAAAIATAADDSAAAGGTAEAVGSGEPGRRRNLMAAARRGVITAAALVAGCLVMINLGFLGERTLTPLARYAAVSRPFQALARLPVLRALPLPVPLPYVEGLDMVARDTHAGSPIYLHGRHSLHGFPEYFLVAMAVKMPAGTLGLLALALWLWASGRRRAPGAEAYLVVPALFLLAYVSLALEQQVGLRYLLPAFPFLFVFTARVAASAPAPRHSAARREAAAGEPAANRRQDGPGRAESSLAGWGLTILTGLLAGWTAVSSLAVHPRYIPYFNELAGGSPRGYRWLADSNLDWGQDGAYMHGDYARTSPVRLWFDPTGPIAGRIAVGLSSLVEDPHNAWLREHFRPSATPRDSWAVFDVSEADLERCCAGMERAWPLPGDAGNLAPAGLAVGAAEGLEVRLLGRLNDGMLGANTDRDAARSAPSPRPVRAWFGIAWLRPQRLGRVVAHPAFLSRGPDWRRFLATDYVWQWWDGSRWQDLPGTRVSGNRQARIEHRFPPVETTAVRLVVARQLNAHGTESEPDVFRAACLEVAAFPP
jgi:4-amino-4-deoxy-L-arabinose transferase-like glycosyltransferase